MKFQNRQNKYMVKTNTISSSLLLVSICHPLYPYFPLSPKYIYDRYLQSLCLLFQTSWLHKVGLLFTTSLSLIMGHIFFSSLFFPCLVIFDYMHNIIDDTLQRIWILCLVLKGIYLNCQKVLQILSGLVSFCVRVSLFWFCPLSQHVALILKLGFYFQGICCLK